MDKRIRDDVAFEIGTPVKVERGSGKEAVRGECRIVGAYQHEYLLTTMPAAHGKAVFQTGSEPCTVYLLNGGAVLGFRSRVEKIITGPLPMLLIRYPTAVEEMTLRKHGRIGCSLDVRLVVLPPPEDEIDKALAARSLNTGGGPFGPLEAVVIDLARGGCQLAIRLIDPQCPEEVLASRMPQEQRKHYYPKVLEARLKREAVVELELEFPLPVGRKFREVRAVVRWAKIEAGVFFAGLQFIEQKLAFSEGVRSLMEYHEKYFQRSLVPPKR